jgi:hypothetical protein
MLKIHAEYDRDTSSAKFRAISRQIYFPSLPVVSAGYCQRTLVDESGTTRTQMGTQNTLQMVAVHGTPCAVPPITVTVTATLVLLYEQTAVLCFLGSCNSHLVTTVGF